MLNNQNPKIVITGATGKLGSLIITELLRLLPPTSIGISVRDPSKATDLSTKGIRVRKGSYEDFSSLTDSFSGADTVLLISSSDRTGQGKKHHATAIKAAKTAGVRCIYYTSHQAASPSSAFWPAQDHYATERMVEDSGMDYVILRNGFYTDSMNLFITGIESGVLAVPKDGKVSWTAHEDLAKATAKLLVRPPKSGGEVITLVSDKAIDMDDVAKVYGEVNGKEIKREIKDMEVYKAEVKAWGLPDLAVDLVAGFWKAAENGEFYSADKAMKGLIEGNFVCVRDMFEGAKKAADQ